MRNFTGKVDNTAPASSGILTAAEDEVRFEELEQAVFTSGQTLDGAGGPDTNTQMLAEAMARYASGGVWCTDSGAANAYVVSTPLSFVLPKAYFAGMQIVFVPSADNTGAATCSANGIGAKPIYAYDGSSLSGGEILASRHTVLIYDPSLNAAAGGWRIAPWAAPPAAGGGGEANTAANVGSGTGVQGLYKTKSGVELRFYSLKGINGIAVALNGDVLEIDGSGGIGSQLRIYPEALTASGTLSVTDNGGGQIEVDAGQEFLHRGVTVYDTDDYSAGARQFSTLANKTYHLNFDFTTGNFALTDRTAVDETDPDYDSSYDYMLIARVVTDGSNNATITELVNKDRLLDQQTGSGTPTSSSGSNSASRTFTETYNWARTPKAIATPTIVTTNDPITDIDMLVTTTPNRYQTTVFIRWDFATSLGYNLFLYV